MKRKYGFFFGFAVLLIAAMFIAAGCDMNGDDDEDGGNSGSVVDGSGSVVDGSGNPDPSKLNGTVWRRAEDGYTAMLIITGTSTFTMADSDGYTNSGVYSVSGKTITFTGRADTITATISNNGKTLRVTEGGNFTRIGNEPVETAQRGYYGTWVNKNNVLRVITPTTYKLQQGSEWSYTMVITSWTPVTNTDASASNDYPDGYVVSGMMIAHTGSTIYYSDINAPLPEVGGSYSETIFMGADKQAILKSKTGAYDYFGIYTKQ
jgi:hypothetical protein